MLYSSFLYRNKGKLSRLLVISIGLAFKYSKQFLYEINNYFKNSESLYIIHTIPKKINKIFMYDLDINYS